VLPIEGAQEAPADEAGVALLGRHSLRRARAWEGQHVRFSYAASKQQIEAGVARMPDFIPRTEHQEGGVRCLRSKSHERGLAPSVTVAAVIERDGKFLFVEELIDGSTSSTSPPGTSTPASPSPPLRARGAGGDGATSSSRPAWSVSTMALRAEGRDVPRFCFSGKAPGKKAIVPRQGDHCHALGSRWRR